MKEAYSGTEARDFVNNTSIGTTDGPYRQSNTYDAWDNSLTSGGRFWSRNVTDTASFNEFNRNPNWNYDAEGNLITRNEMMGNTGAASSSYDAAGRRTRVAQMRPCWQEPQHLYKLHVYANTQTYDGDGQMTRYEQTHRTSINGPHGDGSPQITYYLRSSVLGGRVISEYDGADGQSTWSLTYVYAGSQRIGTLGWYGSGLARNYWRQNDPVTGDETVTVDNGEMSTGSVFDPNGADVGIEDPFPPEGEEDGVCVNYDPNYVPSGPEPALLNPLEDGSANCVIDGIEQRCGSMGSESTAKCPDEGCGAQVGRDGKIRTPFQAFMDGWGGYLPPGAIYDGEGMWHILAGERDDPDGKQKTIRPEHRDMRFNHAGSLPQNPGAGSFRACVGGLESTGFSQDAANLINQISSAEGTSRDLLAVTWKNENHFELRPKPNMNGVPNDINAWDVGPFHINIGYTLAAVSPKGVNFKGLTVEGVFGYTFYHSDGKTPTTTFDGVPLQNGQMAARRLNFAGSNDRERAVNYAGRKNGPARGRDYDTWNNAFANFFKCYRGY